MIPLSWRLGALAATLALAGVGLWRYGAARHSDGVVEGKAYVQERWDAQKAADVLATQAAQESQRLRERSMQVKVDEAGAHHAEEIAARERDIAALRRRTERLQLDIDGFARAAGAPDDTLAACRDRAATLGGLLSAALRDGAECAADAEGLASSVRALLSAWPASGPAP